MQQMSEQEAAAYQMAAAAHLFVGTGGHHKELNERVAITWGQRPTDPR